MNKGRKNFFPKRTISISLVLILSLLALTGCGTLDTLLKKEGAMENKSAQWVGGDNPSLPASSVNSGEGINVTLYFSDSSGKYLVQEQRTLPKTLSVARETVNQWLNGPAVNDPNVQPAVSPDTSLLDISLKDNIVTVDLSKEFLQPYEAVSPEVALYGLVNTLTQFSTIKEVKLRVEGKPLKSYAGLEADHLSKKASLVRTSSNNNTKPVDAAKTGKGSSALPDSPSVLNLFSFPSSSS